MAKLVRLHFSESDRHRGRPLYEAIVEKCREMRIAGATVFRGLEGYGETAGLHRARWFTREQPIVVVIVDAAENIDRLLPAVEEMMDTGLIALSEVSVVRVQKSARQ
ncbi:MAG: DUF190 domain-containing protein [Acidobacteria bacterium]|nr:DUF190 domain-containing protein [Acidobacteriota bacterium]MBI3471148.1 DUF190 domain-containing protein [Candidatus Solibacter usitatus]